MLELTKAKVEIKFEGQIYNMRVPTYKEGIAYEVELQKIATDPIASGDHLISYLEKLGLPKEISEQLELSHLFKILDAISEAKKK